MKLLITLDFPPEIGGIQKYLYGIVRFCYNENDKVFVAGISYTSEGNPEICALVKYFSSPLSYINRKFSLLLLLFPYFRLCKRNHGNLSVECGNLYAAFVPWLLSWITRQPYSIYTYGTELIALKKKSLKNMILRRVLSKAKKVYTLGRYSEKILQKLAIFQPIDIVPPRIILPPQSNVVKKRNKEKYNILCVGRLVKHKGHANLIRAAELLSKEKKYRFIIVGDGPQYNTLKDMCTTLDLKEYIFIKQNLSDELLYKEFGEADIFVLPSLETPSGTEGFGIVLLEAMAYHVPIVASATGGIPEVLDNGNCGLLIEPGNVDSLVDAIRHIAENSSFAENFAQNAYERLIAHYVWK